MSNVHKLTALHTSMLCPGVEASWLAHRSFTVNQQDSQVVGLLGIIYKRTPYGRQRTVWHSGFSTGNGIAMAMALQAACQSLKGTSPSGWDSSGTWPVESRGGPPSCHRCMPHYVHHLTGGDPPVVQEPLGWERLGRTYSHRISGSTWHGGRQRREILGIRSSVRQRSARSSPPRRRTALRGYNLQTFPRRRDVHGSKFLDPTRPKPKSIGPNSTRPTNFGKIWTWPDPNQRQFACTKAVH